MASRKESITISTQISIDLHQKLKTKAASKGKQLDEYVRALLEEQACYEGECRLSHVPNAKTAKVIKDAREGKGVVSQSIDELFNKIVK